VGTTLNGQRQPFCTFLAKGTPSTTITQEGLALPVEILAGVSHPTRLRRITDRVHAIALAESGANFVEVFDSLIARGRTRDEAYATTVRVFRGSTPAASPFTKDLAYHKGFVSIYSFMQIAVRRGGSTGSRCSSAGSSRSRTSARSPTWSSRSSWCRRSTCRHRSPI
jgi:hypothetical protein